MKLLVWRISYSTLGASLASFFIMFPFATRWPPNSEMNPAFIVLIGLIGAAFCFENIYKVWWNFRHRGWQDRNKEPVTGIYKEPGKICIVGQFITVAILSAVVAINYGFIRYFEL